MEKYIEMDFGYAYNLAGFLKAKILKNDPGEYILDFIDLDYNKIIKPHKETVLHTYIFNVLRDEIEYVGKKADPEELASEWEELLEIYNHKFKKSKRKSYEYITYLEAEIKQNIIKKIADETFQLLFGDRMFCLKFNEIIAEHIRSLAVDDFPSLLKSDGKVKRCSSFPVWVQRAVYMRERGKCAVCLNDISGIITTDFKRAIDHIVPLNLGGINDITNLQLLCKTCNDKKLGHTIVTSKKYPQYF